LEKKKKVGDKGSDPEKKTRKTKKKSRSKGKKNTWRVLWKETAKT